MLRETRPMRMSTNETIDIPSTTSSPPRRRHSERNSRKRPPSTSPDSYQKARNREADEYNKKYSIFKRVKPNL